MRRRILLADDSVTIQKVIELTFMDEDYDVRPFSNGDDAIQAIPEVDPDFVIADVHMPGANGYEVCRRSKERRPDVPVLLLVGTFEPFDEAQARAAGADSFLKKPFDSQELLQRVGDLLASRQAAPAPGPAETVRMSELPSMAEMELAPEPAPAEEWGGFQVEAEPEPFSAGSEFSLEEPSQDWRQTPYQPEGEQLFELEEEPAALAPPSDSVFGFEPQPIAAEPRPAGFDLPLTETERLGVPEPAAPLVAGLEETEETERRIDAPAPPSVEQAHEPQAEARMAAAPAVSAAVSAGTGISDADVDRIARRVVELLGDKAMREVAWEVVPDLAEVVIRDRLRELESQAENLE